MNIDKSVFLGISRARKVVVDVLGINIFKYFNVCILILLLSERNLHPVSVIGKDKKISLQLKPPPIQGRKNKRSNCKDLLLNTLTL